MNVEYWQAGGIPPTVARGGGNMEYWQAGSIPAMMATPVFSLTAQGATHAHTAGNAVLAATEPSTSAGGLYFPSPFATQWPRRFGR